MASEQPPTAVATTPEAEPQEKPLTYAVPPELTAKLAAPVVERLKAVLELQKEHDEENRNMLAEFLAIELKYEVIFQALFKRRSEVLAASEPEPKGIPGFWLQAFKNSVIAEVIEAHDEPILEHLEDVSYEMLPNREGYRLVFRFSENDFFTNTELHKTVFVSDMYGDEEISSTKGSTVDWKPNKNVTVQLKSKPAQRRGRGRGRGGRGGASKPVEVPVPSFFRFFESTPEVESLDDMDEEDFMMLAEQQETDGHLSSAIRDIIARAAVLYTGEDVDEEEDDDEHEHGDSDHDDDDDSDEEVPVARKPRKKNRKAKASVEEVEDDDAEGAKSPALSFPSFGAAPAFNFNFGSGTGTTLGAPAGGAKQFNFTPKSDGKSA